MKNYIFYLVSFIIIQLSIDFVIGQGADDNLQNLCVSKDNCENCLAAHFDCSWCTDKNFNYAERCSSKEILLNLNCSNSNIILNHEEIQIIENNPVHDYERIEGKLTPNAVQLQPQKLKIKLVKGHPQRFKLTYRPAKNNPLDLYYLMDLTWSMKDDKETLIKISEELAEALQTLTENYRLGYGSFADKPTMPMIMPNKKNPCSMENSECEPTYGFRHHLALTRDIKKFVQKVNASQVTGNLDNLEGGLDALMQVIVCTDEIGWSNEARKIVVLATDGFMHFAGDGLLAGITQRNDKRCHLNKNGEYEGTLKYDYPSLEEIYRELTKRKINVIFAVTQNVAPNYYQLGDLMKDISSVEILSLDSSNILDLIKKGHQTLIKKVQFEHASPSIIDISYETNCGEQHKELKKTIFCNGIKFGDEIEFFINMELKEFPDDDVYNYVVRIEEAGLSEFLEIEVELQKPCPCTEDAIVAQEGRLLCNDRGNFQCGMCMCDDGWLGTTCSCDSGNYTTNRGLEDRCRKPSKNNIQNEICSNHGDCDCGECHCIPGFVGKYCECEDCNGRCFDEREICSCGKCICKYGWSGDKCNCRETTDGCLSPKDTSICSNRGKCTCGECICDDPYLGRFCEIGIQSNNMLCEFYSQCVECLINQRRWKKKALECNNFCESQDQIPFSYDFNQYIFDNETKCLVRTTEEDETKCDHYFTYDINANGINFLKINMDPCKPIDKAQIFGVFFAATILVGIISIIVYRGYFFFKDKKEYRDFENECKNTMKDKSTIAMQSPLYKDPISTYQVPEYEEY